MIKVLFFAQMREQVGKSEHELAYNGMSSVNDVIDSLCEELPEFLEVVSQGQTLAAVNHTLVSLTHPINDGDEVAFFPPVTGG